MHIWSIDHQYLTWHLSGILWWKCEIAYTYDYSSRLGDHSKSVRFEKRDIRTLVTEAVFGGYFTIRGRLVQGFKLFLFHGIERKLVHTITVCIFRYWNEINPFIKEIQQKSAILKYLYYEYFALILLSIQILPVVFLGIEMKINSFITNTAKIGNFEIPLLRWARSPSNITIYKITRPMSLSCLLITNGPSSCIDDNDKTPSKARYEATNARLIHRLQNLVHSPAKLFGISR